MKHALEIGGEDFVTEEIHCIRLTEPVYPGTRGVPASARALRAIIAAQTAGKEPDAADVERLRDIEAEAQTWRLELARLQ